MLLACIALLNGGCLVVAAGAAGAGAVAYYKGNVTETYTSDFESTWQATHAALTELGLPVKSQSRDNFSGTIESVTGAGDRVKIHVEEERAKLPGDAVRTKVGVRVATFGDGEVSRRILERIPVTAAAPASASQPVSPASAPAP